MSPGRSHGTFKRRATAKVVRQVSLSPGERERISPAQSADEGCESQLWTDTFPVWMGVLSRRGMKPHHFLIIIAWVVCVMGFVIRYKMVDPKVHGIHPEASAGTVSAGLPQGRCRLADGGDGPCA